MSKTMTYGQLHSIIVNDNTNINNVIRSYIGESANASVVAVYDDQLVLLDTINEDFYTCNYSYNPDKLSVILSDFEKVNLEEESSASFKVAVKDYLLSESEDSKELLDAYLKSLNKSKASVESIVAECLADKSYENAADFEELSFINEEFEDLRNSEFFEAYQERLITHPLNNVLFLDWETPVAFTLLETTEPKAYINSQSKEKAKKLCASKDWKKKVCGACREFVEDVEQGGDALLEMFSENMSLFSLNAVELKEAVAKAVMLDPELNGQYKQVAEAVVHFVNNDESFEYLRESIDIDSSSDASDEKKDDEKKDDNMPADDSADEKKDDEEKKDDDKARELTSDEKKDLIDALKTAKEKVTDEKLKDMISELLSKFEDEDGNVEEGCRPDDVKEAVRLLSI